MSIILVGLVTGTLIGMIGIGGVLLSPVLTFLLGIDLHVAMASSSMSFLLTGVVGTLSYAKKGSISWGMVLWLSIGIVPATLLGAKVNTLLSTNILVIVLGVLIIFSGVNVLRKQTALEDRKSGLNKGWFIFIGVLVGFGSALTGTGGPVLLVPILVTLKYPALAAIGVSQAAQLPIAVFATVGFLLFGGIDFNLGITLGVVQAVGVVLGAKLAHEISPLRLKQIVAIALIGVGALMIGRMMF